MHIDVGGSHALLEAARDTVRAWAARDVAELAAGLARAGWAVVEIDTASGEDWTGEVSDGVVVAVDGARVWRVTARPGGEGRRWVWHFTVEPRPATSIVPLVDDGSLPCGDGHPPRDVVAALIAQARSLRGGVADTALVGR
ncbi:hypothetical protein GCM10022221_67530 [Actinocorallia aurea]